MGRPKTSRSKTGAEEARQTLPELLARAHAGTSTIITRHGQDYAAIVPLARVREARHGLPFLDLRGSGAGLWTGPDAVGAQRAEWE